VLTALQVCTSVQPSVDTTTVQLCIESDIIPLIRRALDNEDAQVADPLRGWEGGQIIAVPISRELASMPNEHGTLDWRSEEPLDDGEATNLKIQGNAQNKIGSHKQKGEQDHRRRKRRAQDAGTYQTRSKLATKHLPTSITTALSVGQLRIAQGGYIGKRVQTQSKDVQDLGSLLQKGFKLVKWDGW
jgi:hypothetical protein